MTCFHSSLSLGLFALLAACQAASCTTSSSRDPVPVAEPPDVFEQARGWLGGDLSRATAALCGAGAPVAPAESGGPLAVRRCSSLEAPWRVELVSRGERVELIALSREIGDEESATLPALSTWCAEPQVRLDDSTVWRRCGPPVLVAASGRVLLARPGQRLFVALATSDVALEAFYASIGLSLR